MVAMFVDLRAAFDSVDREVLIEAMRERGDKGEFDKEDRGGVGGTKCRVRVGGEESDSFWTARGVRQEHPLSPLIFNLLTADLEEEMGSVKWGGVRLGGGRMYTLAIRRRHHITSGG